jgi:DnaJ-class molecular chaperone
VTVLNRDYYEVLGVPKDADDDEIREAFHTLARKWHPGVAGAPEAEERFRELAEAYSVLSNRETRMHYDRHGSRRPGSQDVHDEIELRSFEAEKGVRKLVTFHATVRCITCMGDDTAAKPDPECPRCGGRGLVERERRLRLRIPPGVEDDAVLRVQGEGSEALTGTAPGDLIVHVHVLPPPGDPRIVRYLAFVLLVVAVATLALYLMR